MNLARTCLRRPAFRKVIGVSILAIATLGVLNWFVFPLPHHLLKRPTSTFVYSRDNHLLNCFTSTDRFWRKPVRLEQVSPLMISTVLACEDRWYHWHPGFNPVSLAQAAVDNLRAGRFERGGSTITMQIARMIEPKERTIPNKLLEILRAVQLEISYSKDELLEIYFNLAPYGGNIEGIGAATWLYFGKTPYRLSVSEIAVLTALPSSPTKLRPDRDLAACLNRRDLVLAVMHERGLISRDELGQALREEVPIARVSPAVAAPHFCQSAMMAQPSQPEIRSTLDYGIQITCERLARNYQVGLASKGIHNLAAVVLDNRSGELLALVGSADFDDAGNHGQVNGALAPRSPGSALKPFVYALGLDKGFISSALKVEDLPVNYAGYIPVNYDEQYNGVVSISEALIQSLNVPAVNLTVQVGLKELFNLLRAGGITTLTRKHVEYGLPMILGSCEVNLVELSNLYATLARGGEYVPVRYTRERESCRPVRLFSREAAYLITEILVDLKRPDMPSSWEFTVGMPKVAWKTGTSYGRKDAWAIGYDPDYTVGVWTGNFSAEGSVALVGAETAAPLMFDIFTALRPDGSPTWFEPPAGIDERMVCAVSGRIATQACPDQIGEEYIVGVSPNAKCSVHRSIMVDSRTGHSVCRYCAVDGRSREITVEDWPPRLASWLAGRGIVPHHPPHNPECRGELTGDGPVIVSPERDAVYVIRSSVPKQYQHILFQASLPLDSHEAHWFVDGHLFATAPPDSGVFYLPEPGQHRVMCIDSYGRSAGVNFRVQ
ncbi:MAG: penicillin-binding protein 1C [Candidatus Zixiibacteriota bacterium]